MSNNIKQLSGSIELRVTKKGDVQISSNPFYFVTDELKQRNQKVKEKMEVAKK